MAEDAAEGVGGASGLGQRVVEPPAESLANRVALAAAPISASSTAAASLAMLVVLVVLETLTPLERTVFVLREAFGYDHTEIATILGRRPAAVHQLAHRARELVQARRPRHQPDPRARRAATERFLAAAVGGDLPALLDVLPRTWSVLVVDPSEDGDQVRAIYSVVNPDKLVSSRRLTSGRPPFPRGP